ncbi:MAG TPA: isoprenylcysteine carboxylmethyltransferase family protein [Terracidiphilus sp.]|jgi:protein-S-isoprenylcysteine O-methyltransferase Ste14|nr:isoprenylcysteine carboxylmethyltransferase family protein [Terracidiphilus sp.]
MQELHRKTLLGLLRTLAMMLAAVFGPVWTFRYWQGWISLAAFFGPALLITIWVARHDPALLERRLKAGAKAEQRTGQKIVQGIAAVVFLADYVIPAFDHRFGWSRMPWFVVLAGDAMMVIGFTVVFAVFKENSYTSGIIEVARDQRVISTGPYAVVRHPMYTGALIMLFGIPVSLGSWWGLLVNLPMTAGIVWRLLDEEQFLGKNLPGYAGYTGKVKSRLVPGVW